MVRIVDAYVFMRNLNMRELRRICISTYFVPTVLALKLRLSKVASSP